MSSATLTKPVRWRYIVSESGEVVRKKRDKYSLYGCPSTTHAFFWCEGRGRYIVACSSDTRKVNGRPMGCYHVLRTRDAAIMFALAAGGG